jgi:pyroglutamyl-peptidase
MPGEHSNVPNARLEALTRCLAPCESGDSGAGFEVDASAGHDLARALCGGFRQTARAQLCRHVDDADAERALDALPKGWWFDPQELQVVVTGFGPFLDHARNPSWDVAQSFAEVLAENFSVSSACVPVTYGDAASFSRRQGVDHGQRLVVHFGLRASGPNVAIERYAHNCRGGTRDESGQDQRYWSDLVEPGGPVALETLLDVRRLAMALDERLRGDESDPIDARLRAKMSRDVGEYVCNAIYYHSLQAVAAARQAECAGEALFVHVPLLDPARADSVGARFGEVFRIHLLGLLNSD